MEKMGFGRAKAMLNKLGPAVKAEFAKANRENAAAIVDLARVLIPERTGASRAMIAAYDAPDGGQLIDFGKKAKVIEGGQAPRPFVNPAMQATKKARKARNRKAIQDAAKAVR